MTSSNDADIKIPYQTDWVFVALCIGPALTLTGLALFGSYIFG